MSRDERPSDRAIAEKILRLLRERLRNMNQSSYSIRAEIRTLQQGKASQ
jgi:hypothetical protein